METEGDKVMASIQRYLGQQPKVVKVFNPVTLCSGDLQGENKGYHLDEQVAYAELSDEVCEFYGIQFPDGEVFLLGADTSIAISKDGNRILREARGRLRDQIKEIETQLANT